MKSTPDPEDSPTGRPDGDDFWTLMTRYAPALGLVPGSAVAGYLIGDVLDHAFSTTFLRFVFLVLGVVGESCN